MWRYDRPFRKRGINYTIRIIQKKKVHPSDPTQLKFNETWLIHVLTKKTQEIEIAEKQIDSKKKRKLLRNVMNVCKGTEKLINDEERQKPPRNVALG